MDINKLRVAVNICFFKNYSTNMGNVCIFVHILPKTIYVGRPILGKPTTSRTQLGTHKELAEIRMGHEQETRPVTQGIETLWLAT